jgi:hypothetical protein
MKILVDNDRGGRRDPADLESRRWNKGGVMTAWPLPLINHIFTDKI